MPAALIRAGGRTPRRTGASRGSGRPLSLETTDGGAGLSIGAFRMPRRRRIAGAPANPRVPGVSGRWHVPRVLGHGRGLVGAGAGGVSMPTVRSDMRPSGQGGMRRLAAACGSVRDEHRDIGSERGDASLSRHVFGRRALSVVATLGSSRLVATHDCRSALVRQCGTSAAAADTVRMGRSEQRA